MSPAERSFHGLLSATIKGQFELFTKVRVADVLTPEKGLNRRKWQSAFNKISSKHFDFVLCDKSDLSVLCAIELDDKSHGQKKQRARDDFRNQACKSAGFELRRIKVKASYTKAELEELLKGFLNYTL